MEKKSINYSKLRRRCRVIEQKKLHPARQWSDDDLFSVVVWQVATVELKEWTWHFHLLSFFFFHASAFKAWFHYLFFDALRLSAFAGMAAATG